MLPFYVLDFLESFSSIFSAISIAAGVILLATGLRRLEKQQKKVNTAELLSLHYRNPHLPHDAIAVLSADQFALRSWAKSPEKAEAYRKILDYLNEMEFVAVLINSEVVDEQIARKMMCSSVVYAFRSMIEYIMKARAETSSPSLYTELEALAHRWGRGRDF